MEGGFQFVTKVKRSKFPHFIFITLMCGFKFIFLKCACAEKSYH